MAGVHSALTTRVCRFEIAASRPWRKKPYSAVAVLVIGVPGRVAASPGTAVAIRAMDSHKKMTLDNIRPFPPAGAPGGGIRRKIIEVVRSMASFTGRSASFADRRRLIDLDLEVHGCGPPAPEMSGRLILMAVTSISTPLPSADGVSPQALAALLYEKVLPGGPVGAET